MPRYTEVNAMLCSATLKFFLFLEEDPPIRHVYTQPEHTCFSSKAGFRLARKTAINCFSVGHINAPLLIL